MKDFFRFSEVLNSDLKVTLAYDSKGGMRIVKEEDTKFGTTRYEEIYLSREAMFQVALNLLQESKYKK